MEYLIIALQLILSLSILVIIHELGHFLPAKWFGTKVEKFYLFFDPWFSLFKTQKGGTEYGIGWLPLGGYVKIAGMIDESMDKAQLDKPAESWEFRAKPTWQRLIIMIGGVTMNVLLAFVIYGFVLYTWGEEYIPVQGAKHGLVCDSVLLKNGLQDGDKIISVNGQVPETFQQMSKDILLNGQRKLMLDRGGEKVEVQLPSNIDEQLLEGGAKMLFSPAVPFWVDSVLPQMPAAQAGFKKGDHIIGVAHQETPYFHQFASELLKYKSQSVEIKVVRGTDSLSLLTQVNDQGKIGVANQNPTKFLDFKTVHYGLADAFSKGVSKSIGTLTAQASSMKLLFSKAGIQQVGGFGSIASLFSPVWNWQVFWEMTALISLLLAFMNILPIPALDGGHVVFLLYEMISGRKPSQKVLEYAQIAGMVVLFSLMLFANGNDLFKWLSK